MRGQTLIRLSWTQTKRKISLNTNYVAFEGVDGSGKTSYIEELSNHLEKNSINFKVVREPGGSKLGEGIRNLLLSHEYEVEPLTEALLFSANRSNLVEEIIKPSIENGIKILSDRSAYSSVAYQGVGRNLGFDKIYEINDIAIGGFWPEKVVLLDIDPEISLKRQKINDRIGSSDLDFFKRVREGYLELADKFKEKFLIVDANNELSSNSKIIYKWLELD